jgi:hypothetical protein
MRRDPLRTTLSGGGASRRQEDPAAWPGITAIARRDRCRLYFHRNPGGYWGLGGTGVSYPSRTARGCGVSRAAVFSRTIRRGQGSVALRLDNNLIGGIPLTLARIQRGMAASLRLAVVVAAILGIGFAVADRAEATPSMSFLPGFSEGTHLGEGTVVTASLGFSGSEYHGEPLPLTELTIRLPKETVLSNVGFPTCPRSTLENIGPTGCPKGSAAGPAGSLTMFVSFGGEYHEEKGAAETFFAPEGGVFLFIDGHAPVSLEIIVVGHYLAASGSLGPAVSFGVPLIGTVPGAPFVSTTELTINLGALEEIEGKLTASVTAPTECATAAGWKADAKFSDGSTEGTRTNETTTACPPAGKRIATTTGLLAASGRVVEGESDSYTATVTPKTAAEAPPTGAVAFREGPFAIFGCEHVSLAPAGSSAKATCESVPMEGIDEITAVYSGDASFSPSESLPAEVIVVGRSQAEDEAAARKRAEEEAAARKHAEEEAAARKRAEEEAAVKKRTAEEAAARAAKQKAEEEAAVKLGAEIRSALTAVLVPTGKSARLIALRRHHSYVVRFNAPTGGEVVISWYWVPKGAHLSSVKPVLVATGRTAVSKAGSAPLALRLTSRGRSLLKTHSLKLTAKGTFTAIGRPAFTATEKFTLR